MSAQLAAKTLLLLLLQHETAGEDLLQEPLQNRNQPQAAKAASLSTAVRVAVVQTTCNVARRLGMVAALSHITGECADTSPCIGNRNGKLLCIDLCHVKEWLIGATETAVMDLRNVGDALRSHLLASEQLVSRSLASERLAGGSAADRLQVTDGVAIVSKKVRPCQPQPSNIELLASSLKCEACAVPLLLSGP